MKIAQKLLEISPVPCNKGNIPFSPSSLMNTRKNLLKGGIEVTDSLTHNTRRKAMVKFILTIPERKA